jgi:hypothetical protein
LNFRKLFQNNQKKFISVSRFYLIIDGKKWKEWDVEDWTAAVVIWKVEDLDMGILFYFM